MCTYHTTHFCGACGACQRARLARWHEQLVAATTLARTKKNTRASTPTSDTYPRTTIPSAR